MQITITAIGEILFDVYPEYKKLGGAPFNFIYHVWKLTGNGNFISRIGMDIEGNEILKYLERQYFNASNIQKDNKYETGAVNVTLDEQKVPTFEIIENRAYDFIELNEKLIEIVSNSNLFYFGSLAQRNTVSYNTIHRLAEVAPKVFCDLNIRQNFYTERIIKESLSKSSAVKLNSDELKLVNDILFKKEYDLKNTAKKLLAEFNLDLLCITLGGDGAYLFNGKEESHYKAEVENIVDTVGAGDAFAAMMSIGYLNNWRVEKTNKLASEFAAEICKVKGAIPGDGDIYKHFVEKMKDE